MVRGPLPPVKNPGSGDKRVKPVKPPKERSKPAKPPRGRVIISPIERPGYKPPKGKPGWKTIQPVRPIVPKKPRPIGRRSGRA
jgi:hypothetical protein